MITSLRRMITCHWSARRIGRYLDDDPAAPLTPAEVKRLEGHLAICERCRGVTEEHRVLRRALDRWWERQIPDEETLARLHATLDRMTSEGTQ